MLQKRFCSLFILYLSLFFSCNEGKNNQNPTNYNNKTDSLQQLANQYPDSLQIQILLQESIYEKGDTLLALNNPQQLVKQYPTQEGIHNAIAVIQLQKKDTAKAINALLASLSINENQPDIEFELAFLEAAIKNSTALDIANRLIYRYTDGAIQAKGHFTKGIYFANLSDHQKAIQEFDSAIIKHFTMVDAYIEKGILQIENGDASEAISTLSKAIALDKKNADILFWTGKAYQQKKEYDQALLYFSETLQLDPNNTAAEQAIKEIKK